MPHPTAMSADAKGDAYEGLVEKNAEDTKSWRQRIVYKLPMFTNSVHYSLVNTLEPRRERACPNQTD